MKRFYCYVLAVAFLITALLVLLIPFIHKSTYDWSAWTLLISLTIISLFVSQLFFRAAFTWKNPKPVNLKLHIDVRIRWMDEQAWWILESFLIHCGYTYKKSAIRYFWFRIINGQGINIGPYYLNGRKQEYPAGLVTIDNRNGADIDTYNRLNGWLKYIIEHLEKWEEKLKNKQIERTDPSVDADLNNLSKLR